MNHRSVGRPKGQPHTGGRVKGSVVRTTSEFGKMLEKALASRKRAKILAQLAQGIQAQRFDKKTGKMIVYSIPPSHEAIRQMNEYQFGRPVQALEHGTTDGLPFPVMLIPAKPEKSDEKSKESK